jgi:hypothetical protein
MAEFRSYQPGQNARAGRIAPYRWDAMRPAILQLYLTEDRTIEQVAALMKERHGFEAK